MEKRDKQQKFVKLANNRVNKAIKSIQLVSNLSNKQNYEYSDEQAQKIIRAIQSEVELMKDGFQKNKSTGNKFQL